MVKPPPAPTAPMCPTATDLFSGATVDVSARLEEAKSAHAIVHAELREGRVGFSPDDPYVFVARVSKEIERSHEDNQRIFQDFLAAYMRGQVAFGVGGLGSCWCDFTVRPGTVERIGLDTKMKPAPPALSERKGTWYIDLHGDPCA